jgi:hypothetical protein
LPFEERLRALGLTRLPSASGRKCRLALSPIAPDTTFASGGSKAGARGDPRAVSRSRKNRTTLVERLRFSTGA